MSDSPCNDCDLECTFRDYIDGCYANKIKRIQENLTDADIKQLSDAKDLCATLYCKTDNDKFLTISSTIRDIIDLHIGI